jgi:hypothetical protein
VCSYDESNGPAGTVELVVAGRGDGSAAVSVEVDGSISDTEDFECELVPGVGDFFGAGSPVRGVLGDVGVTAGPAVRADVADARTVAAGVAAVSTPVTTWTVTCVFVVHPGSPAEAKAIPPAPMRAATPEK